MSNPLSVAQDTTIRIFMDTNDVILDDPPFVWPVKVTITMAEKEQSCHLPSVSSDVQQQTRGNEEAGIDKANDEEDKDDDNYKGKTDLMEELRHQEEIAKEGELSHITFTTQVDWDLMFLHVCATRSATHRGVAIRTALLDAAMETARMINPIAYEQFNEVRRIQRKTTRSKTQKDGVDVILSTVTYNIKPSRWWLEIFKNTGAWDILEKGGTLDEIVNSFIESNKEICY
ncbi:hypothetical protein M408DRAFT_29674 [Serendipita vermifera MAFF 305830]|uniref:Uncharacterized protein n=1 Tax=Serendipita vermifera MAFF 305830 TaxID=933852 RepID=A0A0C2WV68_SERVB|nr:hypothetical protein M408DRAFT_29674 [Serendipita vermifera MAFF 305830]